MQGDTKRDVNLCKRSPVRGGRYALGTQTHTALSLSLLSHTHTNTIAIYLYSEYKWEEPDSPTDCPTALASARFSLTLASGSCLASS